MRAKLILCFCNSEILGEGKINLDSQVVSAVVYSGVVVLLLFIHCLLLIPLFMGV